MEKRKQIVVLTIIFLSIFTVGSILVYYSLPGSSLTEDLRMFFLLLMWIFGAWTSWAGMAWALYANYKFYSEIDRAKEEIDRRMGTKFIGKVGEILKRADERFKELSPKQQEKIVKLADKAVDRIFDRLDRMKTNPPPKKKVKKLESHKEKR